MTLLCMGCLIGALGLAIDAGMLFRARRNVQIAADAAAMAGATASYYGASVTSVNSAADNAASNVDPSITSTKVTVTTGPTLGGTACASCVQVTLYKPVPTIFMSTLSQMLGANNFSSINVSAKAIAGAPGTGATPCGYIMNPTAHDALWLHGKGSITAPGCGMYVNSDASDALCVTGNNNGKSDFAWIATRGTQGSSGNCKQNPGMPVYPNAPAMTPKWEAKPDPANQCNTPGNPSGTISVIAPAGGSLAGSGGPGFGNIVCYGNANGTPVQLSGNLGAGVYVFTTGVTIVGNVTAGSSASSGGAVIAVSNTGCTSACNSANGTFTADTTTNLQVYAPTSGTYNAMALYQSAADTQTMMLTFGSSGSTFDGMIYAPGATLDLHDQGGAATVNFGFVVGQLQDNGNVNINFTDYNAAHPTTSPFRVITLVG